MNQRDLPLSSTPAGIDSDFIFCWVQVPEDLGVRRLLYSISAVILPSASESRKTIEHVLSQQGESLFVVIEPTHFWVWWRKQENGGQEGWLFHI